MYEAIDQLEGEIAELHERLDFHERLLQDKQDQARIERE